MSFMRPVIKKRGGSRTKMYNVRSYMNKTINIIFTE